MDKARQKKILTLVRRLNKVRRQQAKKIDILCVEMVAAHKEFITKLSLLNRSVSFYELIMGQGDLNTLLEITTTYIRERVGQSNVAVFLLNGQGFQYHLLNDTCPIETDFAGCFDESAVKKISRANRVCNFNDMAELGLNDSGGLFGSISAAAVPIKFQGPGVGFLLIYRPVRNKLIAGELASVEAIIPGLYKAIEAAKPSVTGGGRGRSKALISKP